MSLAALGRRRTPISRHQRRIVATANCAVSWSIPTLPQPSLLARVVHPIMNRRFESQEVSAVGLNRYSRDPEISQIVCNISATEERWVADGLSFAAKR